MGVFQIVAGWWRQQPWQLTVGGVSAAHNRPAIRQFEMHLTTSHHVFYRRKEKKK